MKHIICILLAALLAISISGCQQNTEPTESFDFEHHEHQFSPEPTSIGFLIPEELDKLIEYQKQQQNGSLSANSNNNTTYSTSIIPLLQTTQYRNVSVEYTQYDVTYYYYPQNEPYENPFFDYDIGIVVTTSKSDTTFDTVMEQLDLSPVDGKAYYPGNNTWYINFSGKRVSVKFPKSIVLDNADMLDQYFLFEIISD